MTLRDGIAGVGCALLDMLYPDARFSGDAFSRYASRSPGDGGLVPGQLVFSSALDRFAGVPAASVVAELCGGSEPHRNLGGPAIVALVLAAQVLAPHNIPVRYFGFRGDDEIGSSIERIVARTPLGLDGLRRRPGESPSTRVLSDSSAEGGAGERLFINTLGVAEHFRVRDIPAEFFDYDIAFFGGTALVPRLHAELGVALHSARTRGAMTVVGTVYDFLNESRSPDALWPLGEGQRDYPLIDLIVTDAEEARRLTGARVPADAVRRFLEWGSGAAVVTSGADPVTFGASEGRFREAAVATLPVSDEVRRLADTTDPAARDTTGCGDNFMGGILSSIALQRKSVTAPLDLTEAAIDGVCAGAAAWFQLGGTYVEPEPGAALSRIERLRSAYRKQVGMAGR